jgi:hypothetical protein
VGAEVAGRELIPDDRRQIEERLRHWADEEDCELVLTTGGTGFAPSDVTPEATRAVLESARLPAWPRRCAPLPASTPRTGCSRARSPGSAGGP